MPMTIREAKDDKTVEDFVNYIQSLYGSGGYTEYGYRVGVLGYWITFSYEDIIGTTKAYWSRLIINTVAKEFRVFGIRVAEDAIKDRLQDVIESSLTS